MNRFSSRVWAIVVAIALVFGLVAALTPAPVQAGGWQNQGPSWQAPRHAQPQGWHNNNSGGSARWSTSGPPKFIVRDNGADCDRWGYQLTRHGYQRMVNTCCRFGNSTQDYSINPRQAFNPPVAP